MTRDELLAGLVEMESAELSVAEQSMASSFLSQLAAIDPRLAFDRFGHHLFDSADPLSPTLRFSFNRWAKKDVAAACSWFDQQLAAGRFDPENEQHEYLREKLEEFTFHALLASDPEKAAARLETYSLEHRNSILSSYYDQVPEREQAGYANLIRSLLPTDQSTKALSTFILQYTLGPQLSKSEVYDKAAAAMDRINATPAERGAMIESSIPHIFRDMADRGKITSADLDQLRQWTDAQAPEITAKLTGQVLDAAVTRNGNLHYSEAVEMLLACHQSDQNDQGLIAFLAGESTPDYPETAIKLAKQITDETLRREWLDRLQPDPAR